MRPMAVTSRRAGFVAAQRWRALLVGAGLCVALGASGAGAAQEAAKPKPKTMTQVLAESPAGDWRDLDAANTAYLELAGGRVVIELAPEYAPAHVANIKTLLREHYFDGLAILRAHDNYVVQWGDPNAGEKDKAKSLGSAKATLAGEFSRPIAKLAFTTLPDGDVYAPQVGWSGGFPVARDTQAGQAWLTHCYGMIGAGRDNAADSGNGSELYVVIGHAPRHLDRNVTLVGRVVQGMELLSAMPRGNGPLGFYEKPEQRIALRSVRLASDVEPAQRSALQLLRTDSETFKALIETRRNRHDEWYLTQAGKVEVCNVPLPVRVKPTVPQG